MFLTMMKGKIHRATVTQAELNYIGSITVDEALLEAAGILENERVQVVNLNNGSRFETYAISAFFLPPTYKVLQSVKNAFPPKS